MKDLERVEFLRGSNVGGTALIEHPVLELTDDEFRRVIGSVDATLVTHSTMTGSYNTSDPYMCCEATQFCCN